MAEFRHNRRLTELPDEYYRQFIEHHSPMGILQIVSRFYKVSTKLMRTRTRIKEVREARQMAMYLLTCIPALTTEKIGYMFIRDHATVIHSRDTVEHEMAFNPKMRSVVERLCLRIMTAASKTKRVQILGRVTGISYDYASKQFYEAERELIDNGYIAINPIRIVPRTATWREAMNICLTSLINDADGIYKLGNWERSRGAKIESAVAKGLGLKEVMVVNGRHLLM